LGAGRWRALPGLLLAGEGWYNHKQELEFFMRPSQILENHRLEVLETMKRYPMFANLRIIGSVARGEDTEDSDIDFLVDALSDATLCDLGGLIEDLEELLGISVDVVTTGVHINGYMKTTIERDAVAYA